MPLEHLHRMARIVEDAWCAAWVSLGTVDQEPRTFAEDLPECLRVYTPGEPETLLNLVMRYSAPGPVTLDAVERVIAPFREHGLPFQWWLLLGTEPDGLREALRALGMQSWGGATAMALPLDEAERAYQPAVGGVEFERVTSVEDGLTALHLIANVFQIPAEPMRRWTIGNPAFSLYVARWQGRAVAAMATMIADGVAGVYHVATRPGARRRGIAGNLALYALREARAAGCEWAALTATPEARHLYEQLGFRACGVMEQWMPSYRLMSLLTRGTAEVYDFWE